MNDTITRPRYLYVIPRDHNYLSETEFKKELQDFDHLSSYPQILLSFPAHTTRSRLAAPYPAIWSQMYYLYMILYGVMRNRETSVGVIVFEEKVHTIRHMGALVDNVSKLYAHLHVGV